MAVQVRILFWALLFFASTFTLCELQYSSTATAFVAIPYPVPFNPPDNALTSTNNCIR